MAKVVAILLTWCVFIATNYKGNTGMMFGVQGVDSSSSNQKLDPLVHDTLYGKVRGTLRTLDFLGGRQVERYLGIPYASPPVGDLRFERPVPPQPWRDVRDARSLPKACPQTDWEIDYIQFHVPEFQSSDMDEDCLYLNIYVPATAAERKEEEGGRPVLIHVHGGSNEVGMGAMFHGDVISSLADVIVVTFNYRLGYFGFLSDHSSDFPGNYGMYDQVEAFRWVSKNIHYFGGDPGKVTIQGHSAGGNDVGFHLLSPLSKGLFRFAVMMSGSPMAYWGMNNATADSLALSVLHLADSAGCDQDAASMAEVKACLKTRSWRDVNSAIFHFQDGMVNFAPVVDGHFVSVSPQRALTELPLNGEAFMMGVTSGESSKTAEVVEEYQEDGETSFHFGERFAEEHHLAPFSIFGSVPNLGRLLYHEYKDWCHPNNITADRISVSHLISDITFVAPAIKMAELLSVRYDDVYFYTFSHVSRLSKDPRWMEVPHGMDMFYLFGCPLSGHPLHQYTELDMAVSRALIDLWGHFIRHGRPYQSSGTPFPPFRKSNQVYFDVTSNGSDVKIRSDEGYRARQVAFWNCLIAGLMGGNGYTSDSYTTYRTLTWVFIALTSVLLVLVGLLIIGVLYFKKMAKERCVVHATDEKTSC